VVPQHTTLFMLLARTGLRLGEGLGLKAQDLDFTRQSIRVVRAWTHQQIDTPKSGSRTVDMSNQLRDVLLEHLRAQSKSGLANPEGWLFTFDGQQPADPSAVRKAMRRALEDATLAKHHSPHDFRHTFASLLLQAGKSIAYVQKQLGHSRIKLTVDVYGKWLPLGDASTVSCLDDTPAAAGEGSADGSNLVAHSPEPGVSAPRDGD
jgi:integrase